MPRCVFDIDIYQLLVVLLPLLRSSCHPPLFILDDHKSKGTQSSRSNHHLVDIKVVFVCDITVI